MRSRFPKPKTSQAEIDAAKIQLDDVLRKLSDRCDTVSHAVLQGRLTSLRPLLDFPPTYAAKVCTQIRLAIEEFNASQEDSIGN